MKIRRIGGGIPHPPDRSAARWGIVGWLLFIAPGKLLVFSSPLPIDVVEKRLRATGMVLTSTNVGYGAVKLTLRLTGTHIARGFYGWLEADPRNTQKTRLTGQMRTLARAALSRLFICIALGALAIFLAMWDRWWLSLLFMIGAFSFLLLAQYERLTGRDKRLYSAWLLRTIDAHSDKIE